MKKSSLSVIFKYKTSRHLKEKKIVSQFNSVFYDIQLKKCSCIINFYLINFFVFRLLIYKNEKKKTSPYSTITRRQYHERLTLSKERKTSLYNLMNDESVFLGIFERWALTPPLLINPPGS